MEYRRLLKSNDEAKVSIIGMGMGQIHVSSEREMEEVISSALDRGINYFDLVGSESSVYAPFGRAVAGRQDEVFFQLHFGAVYGDDGKYGWSTDLDTIKETFSWELEALGTDYVDFGFLHCIDKESDFEKIVDGGIVDYVKELKARGIVRHIGFSSHTPSVANMILDTGLIDVMMFSINPAYDFEKGDSLGIGTVSERAALFRRCEAEGVGITVMKAFHGGNLLDETLSPFGEALTVTQCIQYALDRPGVLCVLPGIRNMEDLDEVMAYFEASDEEKNYSVIGNFTSDVVAGNCVYCNHCSPCPFGIDVGLVNKYYDLSLAGDTMAAGHYQKLKVNASACTSCGHCDNRCPFGVPQSLRMKVIAEYFGSQ